MEPEEQYLKPAQRLNILLLGLFAVLIFQQAALFPCGISLAATWNTDLLFKVGEQLGEEAKARQAQVLLAPTVCLHRGPLGGRNFESFSEDPYLTGKLAASYINGLQGRRIAATIKRELPSRCIVDSLSRVSYS
jgi:beta-glucosidase-like glycosyl hydrolase